jgi:hypothetical protein
VQSIWVGWSVVAAAGSIRWSVIGENMGVEKTRLRERARFNMVPAGAETRSGIDSGCWVGHGRLKCVFGQRAGNSVCVCVCVCVCL